MGAADYIGLDIHNLDGTDQTKSQWVKVGVTATYQIQVTNSEPYSDDFIISGPGSDANWTVSYFDAQGHDITAAVTGAGYTAHGLGVGQTCALSVEVAPNQGVADGDTKDVLVTATIGSDTAQQDAVLATTTAYIPPTPVQLSVVPPVTQHEVSLSWSQNTDANFGWYEIYRSTTPGFTPSDDTYLDWSPWSDDTSYLDQGLDAGKDYYYKVVVYSGESMTAISNEAHAQTSTLTTGITSDKAALCADGLHQAQITATITDQNGAPVAGQPVSFSVDTLLSGSYMPLDPNGPDNDLAASVFPLTATTDAAGTARTTLTSSRQIDARAIVKATSGAQQAQSNSIPMEDTNGEMIVDADSLPADGQSTANVYLQLSYGDEAVSGHAISFYISAVTDANGNAVQPAADGSFPGYGTITTMQGTTDDTGVAWATYTCGTLAGTIEFEADDSTVVANAMSEYMSSSSKARGIARSGVAKSMAQGAASATGAARHPRIRKKRGTGGSPRPEVKVSMNFFYIRDKAGQHTTTTFRPASALNALNNIWDDKAQIHFFWKDHKNNQCNLDGHAAFPFDANGIGFQTDQLMRSKIGVANSASLDLFFVRALKDFYTESAMGETPLGGPYIYLSDGNGALAGQALGHEAGHALNLHHIIELGINANGKAYETPEDLQWRGNLMYPALYPGTQLLKKQCDDAHQFAAQHLADNR